jgi:biotin operon repressor
MANYEDKKWRGKLIKRGEHLTSLEKLSQGVGLSIRQVRTSLEKLKTTGEVTNKSTPNYSLLVLNNYNDYQKFDKQLDNQVTNERQTNDKRMTTNNNINNINNKNNNTYNADFESFWKLYPRKAGKGKAYDTWKKIKQEQRNTIMLVLPEHIKQEQWIKDNGSYIPHPATWLNQRRWEDEINIYQGKEVIDLDGI